MSAFDYSRFDKIGDNEEEEIPAHVQQAQAEARARAQAAGEPLPGGGTDANEKVPPVNLTKKGKEGRLVFEHEGRTIYEWDQNLEEVNIFIDLPPGLPRHLIEIVIAHKHLKVGMKGNPPFIDEDTWGPVKIDESMWTLVDGEININLQKMNKAEAWDAALIGRSGVQVDDFTKEEVKKKLMRERFQEEHPGFDFSGADFNGAVPDAREFMGGVKRSF
jgi:hypothetical protein